jgi:hypothetical protein
MVCQPPCAGPRARDMEEATRRVTHPAEAFGVQRGWTRREIQEFVKKVQTRVMWRVGRSSGQQDSECVPRVRSVARRGSARGRGPLGDSAGMTPHMGAILRGSPRLLLARLSHEILNMRSANLLAGVATLVGGGFIVYPVVAIVRGTFYDADDGPLDRATQPLGLLAFDGLDDPPLPFYSRRGASVGDRPNDLRACGPAFLRWSYAQARP